MKVLYSSLVEKIKTKPKIDGFCDDLTMLGIEVDDIQSFKGDKVINFDLTPNRGDCFSVKGLIRDYCALKNITFSLKKTHNFKSTKVFTKKIKLSAKEACSAYSAISISNLSPKKTNNFPKKIKNSIKAAGIQSIHPLVDIVNFIMLETGQPMHVFDEDKIKGDLEVRLAKKNEKLQILGNNDLEFKDDCLVIADSKEPIAFAGISGGNYHSVKKSSKNFLIESAYFDPSAIKGKARRYGFQTDASQRFERGVDYNLHEKALAEAVNLIEEIYNGDFSKIETKKNSFFPKQKIIKISSEDINKKLGTSLKENLIISILKRLEISLLEKNNSLLSFKIPSHRFDLSIKEDLVEEVARIIGYDQLPESKSLTVNQNYEVSEYQFTDSIKLFMKNKGFNEVVNYSFLDPKILENLSISKNSISLKNPLNKTISTLRTSLLPSLVSNLEYNLKRGENFLKIFEIGKSFSLDNPQETLNFSGLLFDDEKFKNWNTNQKFDFFYLKGILEDFFAEYRVDKVSWKKTKNNLLHPYASADIFAGKNFIGSIGSINPIFLKNLDIKKPFYYFEILLSAISSNHLTRLKASSVYPSSQRDFSFEVDNSITFEEIQNCVKHSSKAFLQDMKIFDLYEGANIKKGKKSIAFRLSWGSNKKTLSDAEINKEADLIVSDMKKKLNAVLR